MMSVAVYQDSRIAGLVIGQLPRRKYPAEPALRVAACSACMDSPVAVRPRCAAKDRIGQRRSRVQVRIAGADVVIPISRITGGIVVRNRIRPSTYETGALPEAAVVMETVGLDPKFGIDVTLGAGGGMCPLPTLPPTEVTLGAGARECPLTVVAVCGCM